MDNSFKTNTINNQIFERDYFIKYTNEIRSWLEYEEIEKYVAKTDYHIKFDYAYDKSFWTICYFIEFGIYDNCNNLVLVPQNSHESEFFDRLFALCATGSVLQYNTITHKLTEHLDIDEIKSDCQSIIEYLKSLNL